MNAIATVGSLLEEGVRRLGEDVRRLAATSAAADAAATPRLDAELLLAAALGTARARLRSHPEEAAAPAAVDRYQRLIERRAAGEPLAYLTGRREFWSLELAVSPAVLIPRPETELLVERALALHSAGALHGAVALHGAGGAAVVDLGTGCGAIALALASERPDWRVVATDVSEPALAIARANAGTLGLGRVDFRAGPWFEPLGAERFDLIVSNPPYVAADDPVLKDSALRYEPRLALTPGADALECLRALARGAPAHLRPGGWLALEHGADQGQAVRSELVLAGFRSVRSHRDLAGHERMTEGQR